MSTLSVRASRNRGTLAGGGAEATGDREDLLDSASGTPGPPGQRWQEPLRKRLAAGVGCASRAGEAIRGRPSLKRIASEPTGLAEAQLTSRRGGRARPVEAALPGVEEPRDLRLGGEQPAARLGAGEHAIGLRSRRVLTGGDHVVDLAARAKIQSFMSAGSFQWTASRMEHGERNLTIRTLCKLADALGITLAELTAGPSSAAEKAEPKR